MTKSKEKFRKSYSEQVEKQVKRIIARVNKGIRLKQGTYMNFIERMKLKKPQGNIEKHHIIPLHSGGLDIAENLIELEVRDHIAAHLILFLEFGNIGTALSLFSSISCLLTQLLLFLTRSEVEYSF